MKKLLLLLVLVGLVACNRTETVVEEDVVSEEEVVVVEEEEVTEEDLVMVSSDDSYEYYKGNVVLSGTFSVRENLGAERSDCLVLDEDSKAVVPALLVDYLREPYVCFGPSSVEVEAVDGDMVSVRIDSLDLLYRETSGFTYVNVVEVL